MPACPALFISASASGQGKTSVTAALARHHWRLGRRVRVFKTGPDFLDPMLLARASGAPVYSLDLGMVGERDCRALLARAAREADVILIEGVMGLYDGTPSSADLARTFHVPVAAVISAQSIAQTFGAIAFGLAQFRPGVPFHGVLANRVGSERHAALLRDALPQSIRWLGHLPRDPLIALPERHLGLHQPDDIADLEARIERAADALAATALAALPPVVEFGAASHDFRGDAASGIAGVLHAGNRRIFAPAPAGDIGGAHSAATTALSPAGHAAGSATGAAATIGGLPAEAAHTGGRLAGKRIAIARDAAFSFIYPANLDALQTLGAQLAIFSPLADEPLPDGCDALYLPGGYPELHAARLAANATTARAIAAHVAAGKPVVAECGGMLYLGETLTDADGAATPMLGLIPGAASMQRRFAGLGMQMLATRFGVLTGHTFHYSRFVTPLTPTVNATRPDDGAPGEPVYRHGPIVATYLHAYWPSNPQAAAALFSGDPL